MSIFRRLAAISPGFVREALLQGLCEKNPERVIAYSARHLGYAAVMAQGEYGLIQGSSFDEVLLPIYSRRKTWAATAVRFFGNVFEQRGGTYIDVGANIGLTVLPIAQNPNVQCFAFEPDPTNFYHLSENIKRNSKNGNITIHQHAIMDRDCSIELGLNSAGNPGDHRIAANGTSRSVVEVRAVGLDSFFEDLQGPVGVKVDTQGAEPFAIAGGQRLFSNTEALVLEFWPYGIADLNASPHWVYDLLHQFRNVALLPGDVDGELQFESAATVTNELRRQFERSTQTRNFWDIYARR